MIHIYSTQAVIVIIIIYEYLKQDSLIRTKSTVINRVLCLPSLCSSPLRARASAVYGLGNKLKFPVREEVSGQRVQN